MDYFKFWSKVFVFSLVEPVPQSTTTSDRSPHSDPHSKLAEVIAHHLCRISSCHHDLCQRPEQPLVDPANLSLEAFWPSDHFPIISNEFHIVSDFYLQLLEHCIILVKQFQSQRWLLFVDFPFEVATASSRNSNHCCSSISANAGHGSSFVNGAILTLLLQRWLAFQRWLASWLIAVAAPTFANKEFNQGLTYWIPSTPILVRAHWIILEY